MPSSRLAPRGGTASGAASSRRSTRSSKQPIILDRDALEAGDRQPGVGFIGSAAVVLLSDGDNTAQLDPLAWRRSRRRPACASSRSGIGSPNGAVVDIDGFSVATALDAELLRGVARDSGGTYFAAADAATLQRVYDRIDLQLTTVGRNTEITAVFAGARAGPDPGRGRALDALVRAGDLSRALPLAAGALRAADPAGGDRGVRGGSGDGGASTRSRFASLSLVKQALPKRVAVARLVPAGLLLAAMVALVLAMARPQALVTTSRSDTSIMLTIDVSRSMCTTDVPPNRLAAAQAAAHRFVDAQPGGTRHRHRRVRGQRADRRAAHRRP